MLGLGRNPLAPFEIPDFGANLQKRAGKLMS